VYNSRLSPYEDVAFDAVVNELQTLGFQDENSIKEAPHKMQRDNIKMMDESLYGDNWASRTGALNNGGYAQSSAPFETEDEYATINVGADNVWGNGGWQHKHLRCEDDLYDDLGNVDLGLFQQPGPIGSQSIRVRSSSIRKHTNAKNGNLQQGNVLDKLKQGSDVAWKDFDSHGATEIRWNDDDGTYRDVVPNPVSPQPQPLTNVLANGTNPTQITAFANNNLFNPTSYLSQMSTTHSSVLPRYITPPTFVNR